MTSSRRVNLYFEVAMWDFANGSCYALALAPIWCGQALVLHIAFPQAEDPDAELGRAGADRHAIDTLFDLITEFDNVRSQRDGLKMIYLGIDARNQP